MSGTVSRQARPPLQPGDQDQPVIHASIVKSCVAVAAYRGVTPSRAGRKHVPTTNFAKLTIMAYEEIIAGTNIQVSCIIHQKVLNTLYLSPKKLNSITGRGNFVCVDLIIIVYFHESGWGWHAKQAAGFPQYCLIMNIVISQCS